VHAWTKSACVGLAWGILTIVIVVAAGLMGPVRPAQANTRIASSTTQVTQASTLGAAAAPGRAAAPAARYVVQPGDTLSGIAARFAVRGGWPALYAANRPLIGPDPDLIRPGTVLVLPDQRAPARYRVVPGDTLAAIAAALAVPGGWPALYAANRRVIGPDPNLIRAGTVLTIPQPAASGPAPRRSPAPPPSAPAGRGHHSQPGRTPAPGGTAVPSWLTALLLAAGLLIAAALLAVLGLLTRRRRQQATARATQPDTADVSGQRSRSVAAAVRPVAVAARVHPAGVAVPCAVLAAGIMLFTFVESATIRVVPPGGSGHHRVQPRQPGPPALPGGPGRNARPAVRYVVQPGNTLSGIAARFAVRGGWPALYAANRDVIGPDPNLIRAGTVLTVSWSAAPSPAAAGTQQWLKTALATSDQIPSSASTAAAGSRRADR
jgi:nucleoid-associated protein YgaU